MSGGWPTPDEIERDLLAGRAPSADFLFREKCLRMFNQLFRLEENDR